MVNIALIGAERIEVFGAEGMVQSSPPVPVIAENMPIAIASDVTADSDPGADSLEDARGAKITEQSSGPLNLGRKFGDGCDGFRPDDVATGEDVCRSALSQRIPLGIGDAPTS